MWDERYASGQLDPCAYAFLKAEIIALALRLDSKSPDLLWERLAKLSSSRHLRVYWTYQISDHIKSGLRTILNSQSELESFDIPRSHWNSDRSKYRPMKFTLSKRRDKHDLRRTLDKVHLPSDNEFKKLFGEVDAILNKKA